MDENKEIAQIVHDAIEKGATTAEEIHRLVARLPLSILEKLEVFDAMAGDVKRVQDSTIGGIYDLIRFVNDEAEKIANERLKKAS
jgi:hypothetical protein